MLNIIPKKFLLVPFRDGTMQESDQIMENVGQSTRAKGSNEAETKVLGIQLSDRAHQTPAVCWLHFWAVAVRQWAPAGMEAQPNHNVSPSMSSGIRKLLQSRWDGVTCPGTLPWLGLTSVLGA